MPIKTKVMESQQLLDELTEEGTQEICIISKESYVHLRDFHHKIDAFPIVGGPSFYTCGLFEMIDIILQPITLIFCILRDSLNLLERISKTIQDNVYLGSCDAKSLYTNISYSINYRIIFIYFIGRCKTVLSSLEKRP